MEVTEGSKIVIRDEFIDTTNYFCAKILGNIKTKDDLILKRRLAYRTESQTKFWKKIFCLNKECYLYDEGLDMKPVYKELNLGN